MKKIIFLLLLIPISFAFDCSSIDTKDIGIASINYSVFGLIDLNFNEFTFENFSFTFRGVPQIHLDDYYTNGILTTGNFNNTVLFFNKSEITKNLNWYFNTTLYSQYNNNKIEKNVEFPYTEEFPDEIKKYLAFTKTANEDLQIKIETNNLLSGVNDYLTAVELISGFVSYYIDYDLTYFASSSATATEVYNAKKGVCDEFSTLSISMFRSVGIPARYVSGYVYTNIGSKGCTNFEPHSWTEVYIPNHGWISIDTTYKEFFWINSAHIPLYTNEDLLDISSLYIQRKGSEDTDFLNKNIYSFNIELFNFEKIESNLDMNIDASEIVAQDSYFLINVSLTNPTNYWVMDTLISTPIKTIDLINQNHSIPIVIPPMQTLNKYFIFKVPNLECNFTCYSDANFKFSLGGGEYESKIVRIDSDHNVKYGLSGLLDIAKEDDKIISPDLLISNIRFNKNKFLKQKPVLSFSVKNIGNSMTNINLSINYNNILLKENIENLLINEQRNYEKEINLPLEKGLINVSLTFEFGNSSIVKNSNFIVLSEPDYEISMNKLSDFEYNILLNDDEVINDGLLTLFINNNEILNQNVEKSNIIILNENDLNEGNNDIKIVLDYSQENNYYYKILNVKYEYSLSIIEKINKFFTSIINIFKIILAS
jgi:transglutaminase superfamily protein